MHPIVWSIVCSINNNFAKPKPHAQHSLSHQNHQMLHLQKQTLHTQHVHLCNRNVHFFMVELCNVLKLSWSTVSTDPVSCLSKYSLVFLKAFLCILSAAPTISMINLQYVSSDLVYNYYGTSQILLLVWCKYKCVIIILMIISAL